MIVFETMLAGTEWELSAGGKAGRSIQTTKLGGVRSSPWTSHHVKVHPLAMSTREFRTTIHHMRRGSAGAFFKFVRRRHSRDQSCRTQRIT